MKIITDYSMIYSRLWYSGSAIAAQMHVIVAIRRGLSRMFAYARALHVHTATPYFLFDIPLHFPGLKITGSPATEFPENLLINAPIEAF